MRWISHKIITFTTVIFLTDNVISSLIASFGSILPDAVEGSPKSPKWKHIHRKSSHWLLGYVLSLSILWFCFFLLFKINPFNVNTKYLIKIFYVFSQSQHILSVSIFSILFVLFFVNFGSVCHVLQDSLSAKIPIWHPKKRTFSLYLGKTGGRLEFLLVTVCIVVIGIKLLNFVKKFILQNKFI